MYSVCSALRDMSMDSEWRAETKQMRSYVFTLWVSADVYPDVSKMSSLMSVDGCRCFFFETLNWSGGYCLARASFGRFGAAGLSACSERLQELVCLFFFLVS